MPNAMWPSVLTVRDWVWICLKFTWAPTICRWECMYVLNYKPTVFGTWMSCKSTRWFYNEMSTEHKSPKFHQSHSGSSCYCFKFYHKSVFTCRSAYHCDSCDSYCFTNFNCWELKVFPQSIHGAPWWFYRKFLFSTPILLNHRTGDPKTFTEPSFHHGSPFYWVLKRVTYIFCVEIRRFAVDREYVLSLRYSEREWLWGSKTLGNPGKARAHVGSCDFFPTVKFSDKSFVHPSLPPGGETFSFPPWFYLIFLTFSINYTEIREVTGLKPFAGFILRWGGM